MDHNPPVNHVLSLGVVPRFVELLEDEFPSTVFEASNALINCADDKPHTQLLLDHGALDMCVKLLASDGKLCTGIVWLIGQSWGLRVM